MQILSQINILESIYLWLKMLTFQSNTAQNNTPETVEIMWPPNNTNKEKVKWPQLYICAHENIQVILGFLSVLYYLFHNSWSIISCQNCLLLITIAHF